VVLDVPADRKNVHELEHKVLVLESVVHVLVHGMEME